MIPQSKHTAQGSLSRPRNTGRSSLHSGHGCDHGPKRECKPAPSFRVGQWVRTKAGFLCRIEKLGPSDNAAVEVGNGVVWRMLFDVELAIPRAGEWWVYQSEQGGGQPFVVSVAMAENSTLLRERVEAGLLAPLNFGRGNAKEAPLCP